MHNRPQYIRSFITCCIKPACKAIAKHPSLIFTPGFYHATATNAIDALPEPLIRAYAKRRNTDYYNYFY